MAEMTREELIHRMKQYLETTNESELMEALHNIGAVSKTFTRLSELPELPLFRAGVRLGL